MTLSNIAKRMILTISIVSVGAIIASFIYYRSLAFLPFMIGVVLGSLTSIGKVILLERTVNASLSMDKKDVGKYVSLQHLIRLFLSGAVLLLGALIDGISLWGVAVGILAYQIGAYSTKAATK